MLVSRRDIRKRRGVYRVTGRPLQVGLNLNDYLIDYAVVGGGGGGGEFGGTSGLSGGGGGGAGGLLTGIGYQLTPGRLYSIVIGNGGSIATNGEDSILFGSITALGGGGGGNVNGIGKNGGSGGGASGDGIRDGVKSGGYGTAGQGHNGGSTTVSAPAGIDLGGAGGGAGANGGNGGSVDGISGGIGAGISYIFIGSTFYLAGGGASGTNVSGTTILGGLGGGGNGGNTILSATNGAINTGGGGGGGGPIGQPGTGGRGVAFIRIKKTSYTGLIYGSPVIYDLGEYITLKFTNSGHYIA